MMVWKSAVVLNAEIHGVKKQVHGLKKKKMK
jgi:hypothetical protein